MAGDFEKVSALKKLTKLTAVRSYLILQLLHLVCFFTASVVSQAAFDRFAFKIEGVQKDDTIYSKLVTTSEYSSAQQAWFPVFDYFGEKPTKETIFRPEFEFSFRNQSVSRILATSKANIPVLPFLVLTKDGKVGVVAVSKTQNTEEYSGDAVGNTPFVQLPAGAAVFWNRLYVLPAAPGSVAFAYRVCYGQPVDGVAGVKTEIRCIRETGQGGDIVAIKLEKEVEDYVVREVWGKNQVLVAFLSKNRGQAKPGDTTEIKVLSFPLDLTNPADDQKEIKVVDVLKQIKSQANAGELTLLAEQISFDYFTLLPHNATVGFSTVSVENVIFAGITLSTSDPNIKNFTAVNCLLNLAATTLLTDCQVFMNYQLNPTEYFLRITFATMFNNVMGAFAVFCNQTPQSTTNCLAYQVNTTVTVQTVSPVVVSRTAFQSTLHTQEYYPSDSKLIPAEISYETVAFQDPATKAALFYEVTVPGSWPSPYSYVFGPSPSNSFPSGNSATLMRSKGPLGDSVFLQVQQPSVSVQLFDGYTKFYQDVSGQDSFVHKLWNRTRDGKIQYTKDTFAPKYSSDLALIKVLIPKVAQNRISAEGWTVRLPQNSASGNWSSMSLAPSDVKSAILVSKSELRYFRYDKDKMQMEEIDISNSYLTKSFALDLGSGTLDYNCQDFDSITSAGQTWRICLNRSLATQTTDKRTVLAHLVQNNRILILSSVLSEEGAEKTHTLVLRRHLIDGIPEKAGGDDKVEADTVLTVDQGSDSQYQAQFETFGGLLVLAYIKSNITGRLAMSRIYGLEKLDQIRDEIVLSNLPAETRLQALVKSAMHLELRVSWLSTLQKFKSQPLWRLPVASLASTNNFLADGRVNFPVKNLEMTCGSTQQLWIGQGKIWSTISRVHWYEGETKQNGSISEGVVVGMNLSTGDRPPLLCRDDGTILAAHTDYLFTLPGPKPFPYQPHFSLPHSRYSSRSVFDIPAHSVVSAVADSDRTTVTTQTDSRRVSFVLFDRPTLVVAQSPTDSSPTTFAVRFSDATNADTQTQTVAVALVAAQTEATDTLKVAAVGGFTNRERSAFEFEVSVDTAKQSSAYSFWRLGVEGLTDKSTVQLTNRLTVSPAQVWPEETVFDFQSFEGDEYIKVFTNSSLTVVKLQVKALTDTFAFQVAELDLDTKIEGGKYEILGYESLKTSSTVKRGFTGKILLRTSYDNITCTLRVFHLLPNRSLSLNTTRKYSDCPHSQSFVAVYTDKHAFVAAFLDQSGSVRFWSDSANLDWVVSLQTAKIEDAIELLDLSVANQCCLVSVKTSFQPDTASSIKMFTFENDAHSSNKTILRLVSSLGDQDSTIGCSDTTGPTGTKMFRCVLATPTIIKLVEISPESMQIKYLQESANYRNYAPRRVWLSPNLKYFLLFGSQQVINDTNPPQFSRDQAGLLYYSIDSSISGVTYFSGGLDLSDLIAAGIPIISRLRFISATKFTLQKNSAARAVNITVACPQVKASKLTAEQWRSTRLTILGKSGKAIFNSTAEQMLGFNPAPGFKEPTDSNGSKIVLWVLIISAVVLVFGVASYMWFGRNSSQKTSSYPKDGDASLSEGGLGNETLLQE